MRCDGCGFDYEILDPSETPTVLRQRANDYRDLLLSSIGAVADRRPAPDTWSVIEYSCHVRDVLLVQRDRVFLALIEENPSFSSMHRDERVALARYSEERPHDVAGQITTAAQLIAKVFDGLDASQFARPCIYWYPERKQRDVAWLARHTVHELVHHLGDVRSVLERVG